MSLRLLVVLVASMVSFGVAAKAHGRQLRLERELAGYPHGVFGGTNSPFVEALWRQDRMRYGSLVAGLALLTVGLFAVARSRGWGWWCVWRRWWRSSPAGWFAAALVAAGCVVIIGTRRVS